ncbi:hypothetical protein GWK47_024788 [Chionoecetes opilio]|uniref:Uncharacterized protein n=1 Tax=Chionoecetes opilio TaxID=41210 RepID=A0A8J5CDI3_CHIOP|nr:hypothetical protein GWK47_024788 [Chionoecetes opilio]
MQAPCTMPVFETVVSKQKAMILSLTPTSSTSFIQDHCSHVSASRIRACQDPKKELGVIFPCEEGRRCGPPVSPEGDGRSFPSQSRANLSGISWFRSSTIFSAACSLPAIRARWTCFFETAILPMSIPRT